MAKQDMSELGFGKEPVLEASPEDGNRNAMIEEWTHFQASAMADSYITFTAIHECCVDHWKFLSNLGHTLYLN